ncbi:hypothetical protein JCM10295v2_002699 [Rhodotorula toruloides]
MPVVEEHKDGTAFLEVPQHHAAVDLGLPETEYLDDGYDLDAALDNAWYGFDARAAGVVGGRGNEQRHAHEAARRGRHQGEDGLVGRQPEEPAQS